MPELPEVQTTAKELGNTLPGLKIKDVWTNYGGLIHRGKSHIKNKDYFSQFRKKIKGQEIISVSRRGKNVLINLKNKKTILIHMKMTGHLLYGKYSESKNSKSQISKEWQDETWLPDEPVRSPLWDPFNRFIRFVVFLSDRNHLVLSDMRKFAKVCLIETNKKNELEKLGPEPLEKSFTFEVFNKCRNRRPKGKIKQILMDQEIIAGIGNIYSDEILWSTGVHPETESRKIPDKVSRKMYKSLKEILKNGLELKGDSTSDYRRPDGRRGSFQKFHRAYQQTGTKCFKRNCRGIIKKIKIGGRSAHFCPKHQKKYS